LGAGPELHPMFTAIITPAAANEANQRYLTERPSGLSHFD
jgi:hypothetical protein